MDNLKIANEVFNSIEKRNWENVDKQLTNDFTFSGAVSQPIDKKQWVGIHRALQTGIPDFKFNPHQLTSKGDNKVTGKVKITGTHTSELPPTPMVDHSIPATGKKITLPEEDVELTFRDGKLAGLYVKPVEHGGVQGILEQLESTTVR